MLDALGIVSFENDGILVEGLMKYRPIPAISFLGRYRLIDFVMSNMTNSGVSNLKVFVKKQPRSLIEHLGTGRHYNINSKRGKLQILYGESNELTTGIYNHDINAYVQNMQFIEDSKEKYVIIAPGYVVNAMNYADVLDAHIANGADITVVYKQVDNADKAFLGCNALALDGNRVGAIATNMGQDKVRNISLDTYVMSRQLFMDLVNQAAEISSLYTFKDVLSSSVSTLRVEGYEYKGYCACINSLERYYEANMELTDYKVAKTLFNRNWPIHTRTNDSAPTYYGKDAEVENSVIANGCRIDGEVENCIIGRGVTISKGCKIKDSIILPETFVGEDTVIKHAVVDKKVIIQNVKQIVGDDERLVYIKRRDRI